MLLSFDSLFLDPLALALAQQHALAVYIGDPRGFGYSAGRRGDAASPTAPLADVRAFVRLLRNNSDLPVFLAGVLFTGALAQNYVHWPAAEPVDGLLLLSSSLGLWRPTHPAFFRTETYARPARPRPLTL